jgi:hypothetical protein
MNLNYNVMKTSKHILAGLILIAFISCENKDESSVVERKTNLVINIPIVTADIKSGLNSLGNDYSFSGAGTFSPKNIDKTENENSNFQKIEPQDGSVLSIPGVNTGDEILILTMEWGYKSLADDNYNLQDPVDLLSFEYTIKNNVLVVDMDEALVHLIHKIANDNESSIQIMITGKSSFDMNCIANLEIPVIVESQQITPRFELF